MYAYNGIISLRQYKRLLVFDVSSVACLCVPYLVSNTVSFDGIPTILIGVVLAIAYFALIAWLLRYVDQEYLEYSRQGVGAIVTFLIALLYLFKIFFSLVFVTRLFSIVINQTLLPEVGSMTIVIPLLLVAGYLASKGLEVRARASEVLYFIVLIPILIMFLIGLRQIDVANLTPIFTAKLSQIRDGSIVLFLLFNLIELTLFMKPQLQDEVTKDKKKKSIFSYGCQAILISGVTCLLVFLLTVGIMGEKAASNSIWSSITIFQIMEIPGTLINRQDSILLALWLLSIFTVLSGFLHYLSILTKYLCKSKSNNTVLPIVMVLAIIASILPMDIEEYVQYFLRYMVIIGIPQSILVPLVVVLVGKSKRSGKKKVTSSKMNVLLLCVITAVSATFLSGCAGQTEIEDREFVQAMGIDYSDGKLQVELILPDFAKVGGDVKGSDTSEDEQRKTYVADDFYGIEEQYKLRSSKKLDYSHLKAVVFGNGVYENPAIMQMFINYAEKNYKLSKKTYVFVADNTADEVMKYNKNTDGGIGEYLEKLYKNNLANSEKEEITLGQLINDKNNIDFCIQIPLLITLDGKIVIQGEGIVCNSKLVHRITGEDAIYWDILSGYGENSRIFVSDEVNQTKYIIRINQIRQSYHLYPRNDKPYYLVSIEMTGILENGVEDQANIAPADKAKKLDEISSKFNQYLEEKITTQMNTIIKQEQIDYLNIYRQARYKSRELYRQYKDNQLGFLNDLQYEVDVDVRLRQ